MQIRHTAEYSIRSSVLDIIPRGLKSCLTELKRTLVMSMTPSVSKWLRNRGCDIPRIPQWVAELGTEHRALQLWTLLPFHNQINIFCPEPFRIYTEYNLWLPPYPKARDMAVSPCLAFPAAQWLHGTEPEFQSGTLILTFPQTGYFFGLALLVLHHAASLSQWVLHKYWELIGWLIS